MLQANLDGMNEGKEGAVAYKYPDSFVQLLGYMRVYFHLPYRQAEGVVRAHANDKVPSVPDYSTVNRRINKLDIKISERIGNDIVIALHSTGIKITNRGEWLPHKWNVRKGYLKIHVAVDIKEKKIVSLEVTSEEIHDDGSRLKNLVDNALENNTLKTVIADGVYDSKQNFTSLYDSNIEAAIKVRRNSSCRFTGCNPRRKVVIQQLKNLEKWKSSVSLWTKVDS